MTDLIKFDELANTEIKNLLSEKTLRKLQNMLKPNSQAQVSYSQLENSITKLLTTILPDEARCKFLFFEFTRILVMTKGLLKVCYP